MIRSVFSIAHRCTKTPYRSALITVVAMILLAAVTPTQGGQTNAAQTELGDEEADRLAVGDNLASTDDDQARTRTSDWAFSPWWCTD